METKIISKRSGTLNVSIWNDTNDKDLFISKYIWIFHTIAGRFYLDDRHVYKRFVSFVYMGTKGLTKKKIKSKFI